MPKSSANIPEGELIAVAQRALAHAYCPYSGFRVGAAVLTEEGEMISGCNVENASFGLTSCAERNAVFAAVVRDRRKFQAIAIVTEDDGPVWPCGACRQVLAEFGLGMTVISAGKDGSVGRLPLLELLPRAFSFDPKAR